MEQLYALVAGCMVMLGTYLLLSRHLLKIIFGLIILSNAVNLIILTAGRVSATAPAFIATQGEANALSNALPQALILTAIVIGFGLIAFALALVIRVERDLGSLDIEPGTREDRHNRPPVLHDGREIRDEL